jgi:hypothetical protein
VIICQMPSRISSSHPILSTPVPWLTRSTRTTSVSSWASTRSLHTPVPNCFETRLQHGTHRVVCSDLYITRAFLPPAVSDIQLENNMSVIAPSSAHTAASLLSTQPARPAHIDLQGNVHRMSRFPRILRLPPRRRADRVHRPST